MLIEGYILVVSDEVFEDGTINLGRGATEYNVPILKIYKSIDHARICEDAFQNNSDGDYDIEIYKVSFEIPDPRPYEIKAKAERIE